MPATNPILKHVVSTTFGALERLGLHVLPRHYYSPVADRRWLGENSASWRRRASLHFAWDISAQADWLRATCRSDAAEAEALVASFDQVGPGYGRIEALVLYCFVKSQMPRRIVEVGSGVSTRVMLEASTGSNVTVTSIDPHSPLPDGASLRIIRTPAQTVEATVFEQLSDGDLLFIDSTHAVRTGSELARLYLEVIPTLPRGVFVHIHDVFLPYLYPPDVLTWMWDWQETVLLAALLTGNDNLRVLCCESALHHDAPQVIKELFPSYRGEHLPNGLRADPSSGGDFPSSLWLRTT